MGASALLAELRASISDARVLDAIAAVDRAAFVPRGLRTRAWSNEALPIGHGQTISQPLVVARMAVLLEIAPGDRVLDVGTGSGYHAAVLAALGGRVVSIERHEALSRRAAGPLAGTGVELVVGDGTLGWPAGAPYGAINVAAAAQAVPNALTDQLADGGRLVLPLGERLVRVRRQGPELVRDEHECVRFVPLV